MKRKRVEKWIIGAVAKCNNCGFEEENYKLAQRKGRNHHLKTGHEVVVEITYCQEYK
jgi:predicted Zn-ribbon and HTH transcriptional regulator